MLVNGEEAEVRLRMDTLVATSAFYERVRSLAQAHPAPFVVAPGRAGLDLGISSQATARPNRARVKVFPLRETRFAVFFYKPSLLPYSRDRFAYGGRAFAAASVKDEEINAWLTYTAEGLAAARRPPDVMRGFPYDVPA